MKNLIIYGAYLAFIGGVVGAVKWVGLSSDTGMLIIIAAAGILAVFWPRW